MFLCMTTVSVYTLTTVVGVRVTANSSVVGVVVVIVVGTVEGTTIDVSVKVWTD